MMKSRNNFPPSGWLFLQPQTGWSAPPGQSFNVVTNALIAHRKANPGLVKKHNWAIDFNTVANEVDAYNEARCRAHGWLDYVSERPSVDFHRPATLRSTLPRPEPAAGASAVKRVRAGVKTLLDWLGSGGRPVSKELADVRAERCALCPLNGKGGLEHYLTVPASNAIRLQLEIKNDMSLSTPSDEKLGVCEACLCPLKLKIWCPWDHIMKQMDEETYGKLHPSCWILGEQPVIQGLD